MFDRIIQKEMENVKSEDNSLEDFKELKKKKKKTINNKQKKKRKT